MRAGFQAGQRCFRLANQPVRPQLLRHLQYSLHSGRGSTRGFTFGQHARYIFRRPPGPVKGGTAIFAAAALSPLAFVKIGEEPHGEDGRTSEEKMLQASREELENQVPAALRGSKGVRVGIWRFVDTWIVEPIATGLRFLHLVFIFAPVIAAVPMMWFGQRIPDRDNERSGTLLWYRFLVWSM